MTDTELLDLIADEHLIYTIVEYRIAERAMDELTDKSDHEEWIRLNRKHLRIALMRAVKNRTA